MISPQLFVNELNKLGVNFFTGVPDSLLKEFCHYLDSQLLEDKHVIAANEGSAVSLAAGIQVASGNVPLVYLQNSGFGNAINPLLSLVDKDVYSIPMLLLIGWRGEPGTKDEPQHIKQGKVLIPMIKAMDIPYFVLENDEISILESIRKAYKEAIDSKIPVLLLAKKGIFSKYNNDTLIKRNESNKEFLSRYDAIEIILKSFPAETIFISTTGHISREVYQFRHNHNQSHNYDFLTVGSMGHASQIALGISMIKDRKHIVCLDGDGAMIMHMGGITSIGCLGGPYFTHIVINNSVHDSVGGQPTLGFDVSFTEIAKGCRYENVIGPIFRKSDISKLSNIISKSKGPNFVELRVKPGAKSDLMRPLESPIINKIGFQKNLNKD